MPDRRRRRRGLIAATVLVLAACSLPDSDYFGRVPPGAELDPRVFRWCNFGDPDSLDPALTSSTAASPLVSALFDGLTTYGFDGNPVPSLATTWETSDDLRTFTFHLRTDARWSSGRAVTAYDVAYAAIRVTDQATASPNSDNLAPFKGAVATLGRRVFVLRRPVAPYPTGTVVELATAADPPDDPNRRTATHALALRDLGAPASAAYATVLAGTEVVLVMTSGGRATLPTPAGDAAWAFVYRAGAPGSGDGGVYGWVPGVELDGEPAADSAFAIRRVARADEPGLLDSLAGDEPPRPVVSAHGRDLVRSPDALGVRVPDAQTVVFETAQPTPFFLSITDNRALRTEPIEAVARAPTHWTDPDRIVTSGPLHLTAWRRRDGLTLVRSSTYWDHAAVKYERLEVLTVDDQAAATNLYYTAACDATTANVVPSTYMPVLNGEQRGRPYKDYEVTTNLGVYFAWVNTKRITNRHLRRALAFAIDRTAIPRFTHGGEVASAQLTPGTPIAKLAPADLAACGVAEDTPGVALVMTAGELCYVPPPGLNYDDAAAQREVALARAELGDAFPKTLDYRYNAGSEAHKQIAEYLQAAWARLGIDVTLTSEDFNAMLADGRAGNYDIMRFGQQGNVADAESEFMVLFRCGTPDNRGGYCNPAFDKLLDEAQPLRDRRARNAKIREAESVMINDAPVIPLYVYTLKLLVKPYVRDYHSNVINQPPLWRAWIARP